METYTSKQILDYREANDDFFLFDDDFSLMGGLLYKLTDDEEQWLNFVGGRYSIAEYIINNTDNDTGLTTFDPYEFSKALDQDCSGAGKAVCLSDDTALQLIFFMGYQEDNPCNACQDVDYDNCTK